MPTSKSTADTIDRHHKASVMYKVPILCNPSRMLTAVWICFQKLLDRRRQISVLTKRCMLHNMKRARSRPDCSKYTTLISYLNYLVYTDPQGCIVTLHNRQAIKVDIQRIRFFVTCHVFCLPSACSGAQIYIFINCFTAKPQRSIIILYISSSQLKCCPCFFGLQTELK